MKTYLKTTYHEIIEILDVSDKITKYLKLKKLLITQQSRNSSYECQTQN